MMRFAPSFVATMAIVALPAMLPTASAAQEDTTRITVVGVVGDARLTSADRLALEMALHEEAELRALHGELHALERAWRDAEEIAAADDILTPSPVQGALDRLKRLAR